MIVMDTSWLISDHLPEGVHPNDILRPLVIMTIIILAQHTAQMDGQPPLREVLQSQLCNAFIIAVALWKAGSASRHAVGRLSSCLR